jgi:cyclase
MRERPYCRLGSACALVVLLLPFPGLAQAPPGSDRAGPAFTFQEIREDVYLAVGTGTLTVMSNAAIIINEEDVLVVDTHVSPAAAYALLEELEQITTKPVRYVVNTHHHFDHAHGNQVYPESVEIIGHEYAREAMLRGESLAGRTQARFLAPIPERIANLQAQLDTASTDQSRSSLEARLRVQENFLQATQAVVPAPPTITMNDQLTLHRGGREIRMIHLGRGHTAGDVVVYLPEERIVITGDLFYGGLPYMGDAYIPEWIDTLERLKELDFDLVLPGHGMPVSDRGRIDHFQRYMADLWMQIVEFHEAGVPVEEAAARIDLRDHSEHFPQASSLGADADAVDRAYELLDGGYPALP